MTQILSSSTIHDPIPIPASVPDVVAIMTVHNEEDILGPAMAHLTNQGVGVYILDNWSTDSSAVMARAFEGRGLAGFEMFPATPASQYDQMACFKRKAEVALQLRERGARWIIHYDADELRDSPWPGVSLRDGLRRVESEGYNAVNHVLVLFVPTDEDFRAGLDPNVHFPFYIPSPDALDPASDQGVDSAGDAGRSWSRMRGISCSFRGGGFIPFRLSSGIIRSARRPMAGGKSTRNACPVIRARKCGWAGTPITRTSTIRRRFSFINRMIRSLNAMTKPAAQA